MTSQEPELFITWRFLNYRNKALITDFVRKPRTCFSTIIPYLLLETNSLEAWRLGGDAYSRPPCRSLF